MTPAEPLSDRIPRNSLPTTVRMYGVRPSVIVKTTVQSRATANPTATTSITLTAYQAQRLPSHRLRLVSHVPVRWTTLP